LGRRKTEHLDTFEEEDDNENIGKCVKREVIKKT
jgi:hypothetical protein